MSARSRLALTVLGAVCVLVACQSGGNRSGGGGQPAQPQSVPQVFAPAVQPQAASCPYTLDGECDEPGIGTGLCTAGTDTSDCTPPAPSTPPALFQSTPVVAGPDSCQFAFNDTCDEPGTGTGLCAAGTDVSDCSLRPFPVATPAGLNSCQSAFDGVCDDANIGGTGACAANTDTADCVPSSAPVTPAGPNSCQYAFDGECDDATFGGNGVCAAGTDAADCTPRSTPASTPAGENSCQYAFDGECDEVRFGGNGACADFTDAADCS